MIVLYQVTAKSLSTLSLGTPLMTHLGPTDNLQLLTPMDGFII